MRQTRRQSRKFMLGQCFAFLRLPAPGSMDCPVVTRSAVAAARHEDEMGCSCTHLDHPGRGFSSAPGRPWWAAPSHFPRGYWLPDRHLGRNAGAGKLITDTCPFWAN
ncbi:hypothetical protein BT67DRAFT_247727, partial [Trichocladium antarcticum]